MTLPMSTSSPQLRVGILIDSFIQPAWTHRILSDIQASEVACLKLVVKNEAPTPSSWRQRLWNNAAYLLYRLYSRLDRRLFKTSPDAFAPVNLEPLLADCPVINVAPIQKKYSDYLTADDVETIRTYRLDVALRFGFRILRGDILNVPTYGVWSYHHGDNLVNRGGPPGFWEVMENQPTTGAVLQILTDQLDAGQVLCRTHVPTWKRSVIRNRNHLYWLASAFVSRKLTDLHQRGPSALDDDAYQNLYMPYSHRLYQNPTNGECSRVLLGFGARTLQSKLQDWVTHKQWFLAYGFHKDDSPQPASTFYNFKLIIPPKNQDWADPFPIKVNNTYFIFIEVYDHYAKQGHIATLELDAQGHCSQPITVLSRPYHLSYPFVFRWRGDYFMTPETGDNRTVELYRCQQFPGQWQQEASLLEGVRAVDATLLETQGRWWMFVNIGVEGTAHPNDELHLFYADSPLGPWQPHPQNPVKSDCRSARPAGKLFWWHGDLYRPAQDCSYNYGHAIVLNRIDQLDTRTFRETEISRIWPRWTKNIRATHTLNSVEGLTVIDGQWQR